ncbi:hypothetical protein [Campylobacter hyointestinalis]|uniref:hypothetical protein n=1 Tax=Campylobacter hyointestinalis TaxID=198 RepID=UPI0011AD87C7|nr:hypothetical protein [Campylobacter hyointestinalis]TWO20742.1 hypothetical protein YZ80_05965 [Campylobacter hyointestinalis]
MSLAVFNQPPLLQKVGLNLGVKPAPAQFISIKNIPAKKQNVSAGEKKELSILFVTMTLINYERSESKNGKTIKLLEEFYEDIQKLFSNDRYKEHRRSISAKGMKAVHNGFNANIDGKIIEMRFLITSLLLNNFETHNRAVPLPALLDEFWQKWRKKIIKLADDTYDRYEKKGYDKEIEATENHVFEILKQIR